MYRSMLYLCIDECWHVFAFVISYYSCAELSDTWHTNAHESRNVWRQWKMWVRSEARVHEKRSVEYICIHSIHSFRSFI